MRREHIQPDYVSFTGIVFNEEMAKNYNAVQDEINRWIDAGRAVPEFLLNWSHRMFALYADPTVEEYRDKRVRSCSGL